MPPPVKPWANYPPNTSTPINSAALAGLETRVANYVGAVGSVGPGVFGYEDFRVKQHAAGDMTVDVGLPTTLMAAYIALDANGSIERYEYNGLQLNQAIGAADPTNPRIDRIVLLPNTNIDSQIPTIAVVPGIPTAGATLDNLNGAQAFPVGRLLLADVLVGAAAVSIPTANIRDRRSIGTQGTLPFVPSVGGTGIAVDAVVPSYLPGLIPTNNLQVVVGSSTFQIAAALWLPRRIVNATRLRWKYTQAAGTAMTGNYNIGLYDASMRRIVETGVQAFAGAISTFQPRSEVIAATTFEVGLYWLWWGWNALAGAGASISTDGVLTTQTGGSSITPHVSNLAIAFASGGTTSPQTLIGGVDSGGSTSTIGQIGVPNIALSVG